MIRSLAFELVFVTTRSTPVTSFMTYHRPFRARDLLTPGVMLPVSLAVLAAWGRPVVCTAVRR